MLKTIEKTDRLQFRQSELAEQFQKFCQLLDRRIFKLKKQTKHSETTAAFPFDILAFTEQVEQVISEIRHSSQVIHLRYPELADATVQDFQFLLAAWADEAMIKMMGQHHLPMAQQGSVERGLFGTVHAGDEFFHKITRIVERRNEDDILLGAAYWLALVQGFEGRYIGGIGAIDLRRYIGALQAIAVQKIALAGMHKPPKTEGMIHPSPWFIRIGLPLRPRFLCALFLGVLLLCLLTLEIHWSNSTINLTQTLKAMNDLLQINADQQLTK